MAFTIGFLAFLIGAAISLRLNVVILIATIGGAIIGAATVGIAHGNSIGSVVLTVIIVATALQFGYLVGILGRGAVALATRQIPARHIPAPT